MANPFANAIKFLTAINLLASPSGITVRGLMYHLNISRRTVFRLLEALQELGFPLIDEQPRPHVEKIYRLIDSYVVKLPNIAIPNPGFTGEEIELILFILDFCNKLTTIGGTPIFNSIREKITSVMPERSKL
jgi:predicted DNA-binding transcriptional regulator YafY